MLTEAPNQWGTSSVTSKTVRAVNFFKPFSNTNYGIVNSSKTQWSLQNEANSITGYATTYVKLSAWDGRNPTWLAIGN